LLALQAFVASLTSEAKLKGVPPCTSIQEVTFILTQVSHNRVEVWC